MCMRVCACTYSCQILGVALRMCVCVLEIVGVCACARVCACACVLVCACVYVHLQSPNTGRGAAESTESPGYFARAQLFFQEVYINIKFVLYTLDVRICCVCACTKYTHAFAKCVCGAC